MRQQIKSGATSDLLTVDPTSKAIFASRYQTSELLWMESYNIYSAVQIKTGASGFASDNFSIYGSGTKTISVLRILFGISSEAGSDFSQTIAIIKRSTANSGGTPTTLTNVPLDSNEPAATATVTKYSGNPTLGTTVGTVWRGKVQCGQLGDAGIDSAAISFNVDFVKMFGKPVLLRGSNQGLGLNFGSNALQDCQASFIWAEY